jgi:LEA14-like dessication related protein
MNYVKSMVCIGLVAVLGSLPGCASLPELAETYIKQPEVKLRDVQLQGFGFNAQTFLLTFDISNPNPFPLPVNHVSYGLKLDGQPFASGETPGDVSVPASGMTQFAISVDVDLLATAPRLLSILRDGVRREIPWELDGELGLDTPLTSAVTYRNSGVIQLNSDAY